MLDAENELLGACFNVVNADFAYRVSIYRVLFAIGRLERETIGVGGDEGPGVAETLPHSAEACGFAG